MRRRGVPWWKRMRPRLDRGDWIRYGATVVVAVAGQALWMTTIPRSGDPWRDGLVNIVIILVSLSTVLIFGVGMFGKAKDQVMLEDIKRGQDEIIAGQKEIIAGQKEIIAGQKEIIRLLNELIRRFDAHYGPPPDRPPPPSGSGGDGSSRGG